jgi:hypothetical protein
MTHRCVAWHGCYDAPCQLKLSSNEGVIRGGAKVPVYDTTRLTDAPPTRLGIDAQSEAEWRALGFHAVTADPAAADASVLARLLVMGRVHPTSLGEVPSSFLNSRLPSKAGRSLSLMRRR